MLFAQLRRIERTFETTSPQRTNADDDEIDLSKRFGYIITINNAINILSYRSSDSHYNIVVFNEYECVVRSLIAFEKSKQLRVCVRVECCSFVWHTFGFTRLHNNWGRNSTVTSPTVEKTKKQKL